MLTISTPLTPPSAIMQQAVGACSRQTWYHPERPGHGAVSYGSTVVVVECERSESDVLRVDRISVYLAAGDGLADAGELNALEDAACWPYRGIPCEVIAR